MRTIDKVAFLGAAAAVSTLLLCGCASPVASIKAGDGIILAQTVTVYPTTPNRDTNWTVGVLYEVAGVRTKVWVFATECQSGVGDLHIDGEWIRNVIVTGDKPEDRLFDAICRVGMPVVYARARERTSVPN